MDFFEAQARAKRRTTRLVVLFALAVAGIVAAGYFTAVLLLARTSGRGAYAGSGDSAVALWQPEILVWIALGTVAVVGLSSLFKWLSLRQGGSAVAEMVGGRRVDPRTTDLRERQLLNVVEEMAIASGLPMPAVYVLEQEPGLNAFAAGLTTSDAVVAVTRGALDKLTRDELQGVVGHEFSHILNGDMRLNLRLAALLFGILVIALIGRGLLQGLSRTRVRGGNNKNAGGAIAVMLAVGLALMLIGYIGYFFGRLIQAAVSRQREYLADASAVQFTRNPGGVTGALKKIGGYAIGGAIANRHSVEIRHFFFAQGFRSAFGGLFATHPPLPERIRAIDPSFDGRFFEPPAVVDVRRENFHAAGFAPRAHPDEVAARVFGAEARVPAPAPARRIALAPAALVRTAGLPTPAHVEHARALLDRLPDGLTAAAHDPAAAPALVYGLLLDRDASLREKQAALVSRHAGDEPARALAALRPALDRLPDEARLPLLQLTLPALRALEPAALGRFLTTLDELVHADRDVSIFEYALQKVIVHHLEQGRRPAATATAVHSLPAVADEIAVVLSVLARAAAPDEAGAQRAFAAGAGQLPALAGRLALRPPADGGLDRLDAALERLAGASLPIKRRLLTAAGHVAATDDTVSPAEAELLRAIASVLDCPLPPLI